MDKLQQIYDAYLKAGLITDAVSFDVFSQANEDQIKSIYDMGIEKGLMSKTSLENFSEPWGLKKKEGMASDSGDGLSVSPTTPQTAPTEVQTETTAPTATVVSTVEEPEDFSELKIKPDLIAKDEEFVVERLNYLYGNEGFTFEETGVGYDKMNVKSANGNEMTIGLDAFTTKTNIEEARKLDDFIKDNIQQSINIRKDEKVYDRNKIIFETNKEVVESIKVLNMEAETLNEGMQNYLKNQSLLDQEKKALESLSDAQRSAQRQRIINYNNQQKQLNKSLEEIIKYKDSYFNRRAKLEESIGEYTAMSARQGNLGQALREEFARGVGRIGAGYTGYGIDIATELREFAGLPPSEFKERFREKAIAIGKTLPDNFEELTYTQIKGLYPEIIDTKTTTTSAGVGAPGQIITENITQSGQLVSEIIDEVKKTKKGETLPGIREYFVELTGGKNVSEQYMEAKKKEFWAGALIGLAGSIPAFLNPEKFTRVANLVSQVSDYYEEEFQDLDLTENEKASLKLPLAIVSGVLENVGFRNIIDKQPFVRKIFSRIIKNMPDDVTEGTFRNFVRKYVTNSLGRGGATVTAATLAEFETGAMQQIADIGGKALFNNIKEKDLFQNPKNFAEGLGEVFRAGAQEAVGGFVLGTLPAISDAYSKQDFTQVDNDVFDMFKAIRKDSKFQSAFVTDIKQKINNGELTKEQGQKQIDDFNQASALIDQIPADLPLESQKQIMGRLQRKESLQKQIENKDPVLYTKQLEEIKKIDSEIEAISRAESVKTADIKDADLNAAVEDDTVLTEEQQDIDAFFGDETADTTDTVFDNLSINRAGKKQTLTVDNKTRVDRVIGLARLGAQSIAKLLPNTRIILHESNEEFEKYAAPGRAELIGDTIHVNLSSATASTVPHEIFHAVFLSKIKTDPKAAQVAETMMTSVRKTLPDDSDLAKRIDTFAQSYENVSELQNEERLAELIGIMSSEYKTLSKPQKNVVIKFIENLASTFGVDLNISEFTKTDEDVIDLLNTLATKVGTGEEITEGDVEILEQGELIKEADGIIPDNIEDDGPSINLPRQRRDDPFQINYGAIDFKNVKRGSINELSGTNAFVFAADKATFGRIKSPTGLEFDFYGGYLYPYGTPYGWAFTEKIAAQKILNKVKQSDGVGLVMSQVPDGITGSFRFFQYLNAEIAHAINKGVSPQELLNYVNQKLKLTEISSALKAKGLPGQISNLDELNTLMPFEGENKISYLSRGTFAKTFFSAESADKFGIPPITPTAKVDVGVLDYVNAPSLKDVGYGDIISAIQFDKNSDIIEVREGDPGYHPSYPYTISGKPIMVFNNAVDVRKVYPNAVPAGPEKTAARPKGVNKTPLGQRAKPQAARSAMGGQYIAKVPDNIDTTGDPKIRKRQQRSIEDVTRLFNMNDRGFIPKTANLSELRKAVEPFGFEAFKSREDQFGRGGGLYIKQPGRPRYKPTPLRRRQQKSPLNIVTEGRDAGFRDELIVDFFKRKYKKSDGKRLTMKEIREVMDIPLGLENTLPQSFTNLIGGAKAGLSLYNKIESFRKGERVKNKRRKKKLSEAQIMDKAIEFMQKQPEYVDEGVKTKVKGKTKISLSNQQRLMEIDLQKSIGQRPTKNMAARLKNARILVRQSTKTEKDLQKIKRQVRAFIRKSLPPELYTNKEVNDLISKVTLATSTNIENILDEVIDIATAKNNKSLLNRIDNILNGKYETLVSGRKKAIKIDLESKKRLIAIKNTILSESATEEEISERNKVLNTEFLKLAQDPNQSPDVINKMVDLQIAININNALLMGDTDLNKTEALDQAFEGLVGLVQEGRGILKAQIEAQAQEYRRQFGELYFDITGNKLNLDDPDLQEQLDKESKGRKTEKERKALSNRASTIVNNIMRSIDNGVIATAEALDGLMDRISSLPGELFGGRAQVLVTERIDAATREFKKRKLELSVMLDAEMSRYLGKNWRQKNKEFSQLTPTQIYIDSDRVKKAEDALQKDPNSIEKNNAYTKALNEEELILSQNQMYYLYNQYKDPANKKAFEKMYNGQDVRVMNEIENKLNPKLKEFADWQVNVLYPTLYKHYNKTYKQIYRTDMPMNKFYAGYLNREGQGDPERMDLLGDQGVMQTSVGSASTKARSKNNKPIIPTDGTTALTSYIDDMEYFAAYAVPVRDVFKLFDNQNIKKAIRDIHGQKINDLINDAIKKIASRGGERQFLTGFLDMTNSVFLISRLGINPVIMIKQLTSTFTYANDIGIFNWLEYAAKNKTEQLQVFKEIRENSVYMQDRNNNSILRQIENYSEKDANQVLPVGAKTKDWIVNFLMAQVIAGDRAAIMLGGAPNYSYYKAQFKKANPTATEQDAIDHAIIKFERDTKRTQQSSDLQDKDFLQKQGPLYRAANMFLTTPKQYLRKEIQAVRALNRKLMAWDKQAGKGTRGENIRTFVMYHVFMPVLFQYVTLGLPGLLRDFREDDDDDLWRSAILGNLNALFIYGEVFTIIGDKLTGKPWTSSKDVGVLAIAKSLSERYERASKTKNPAKRAQYMQDFYLDLAQATGLPLLTIKKLANNYSKVMDSKDMGEAILRMFNFSEYAIKGSKKRSSGRSKESKKEMKKMFPELYDELYEGEDDEIKALEKELEDIEKDILENLY
tara:strand:- start:3469 stop:11379 length:7911 start_codon:yes stop_codon:yes gene_type:complete